MKKLQYTLHDPSVGASEAPPLYLGTSYAELCQTIRTCFNNAPTPSKGRKILVLDGPSASGKSVLGKRLSKEMKVPLVPMDDFFLPFAMRSKERLNEVGGNLHYERFKEEVILPARQSQLPFSYRPFDCQTGQFLAPICIPEHPCLIIEGVYSLHANFDSYASLAILLCAGKELQKERILARESPAKAQQYFARWIPLEEPYFKDGGLKKRVDLYLKTNFMD